MIRQISHHCFLLLCTVSIAASKQFCYRNSDCNDIHAWCAIGTCECSSGYETHYDQTGDIYCITPQKATIIRIVVPVVVISVTALVVLIIWVCCRRKRLARATQNAVRVQSHRVVVDVPVAATRHTQPYQQVPPSYQQDSSPYNNYGTYNVNQKHIIIN